MVGAVVVVRVMVVKFPWCMLGGVGCVEECCGSRGWDSNAVGRGVGVHAAPGVDIALRARGEGGGGGSQLLLRRCRWPVCERTQSSRNLALPRAESSRPTPRCCWAPTWATAPSRCVVVPCSCTLFPPPCPVFHLLFSPSCAYSLPAARLFLSLPPACPPSGAAHSAVCCNLKIAYFNMPFSSSLLLPGGCGQVNPLQAPARGQGAWAVRVGRAGSAAAGHNGARVCTLIQILKFNSCSTAPGSSSARAGGDGAHRSGSQRTKRPAVGHARTGRQATQQAHCCCAAGGGRGSRNAGIAPQAPSRRYHLPRHHHRRRRRCCCCAAGGGRADRGAGAQKDQAQLGPQGPGAHFR